MRQEEPDTDVPAAFGVAGSWQATLFVGVVTLVLGLVVSFRPTGSVNVIAVLLGILMLISGLFHVVRVFGPNESHRLWLGISGLVLIVIGVVLLRHLHLTVALIGLFIGISWIFQGVSALVVGFSGGADEGRGWWIFFGVVSVLGGIVVTAVPVSSVTALAVLVGIWFVVVGLMEIAAGFLLRHEITKARTTMLHQPPRAGHGAATLLPAAWGRPPATRSAAGAAASCSTTRGSCFPRELARPREPASSHELRPAPETPPRPLPHAAGSEPVLDGV